MLSNPYEVKQFPPESDHVRVGRGFVDSVDSYQCAWEIANRLADAGLVQPSDYVEINNPLNLHRELLGQPATKQLGDLKFGIHYAVYTNGWPTEPDGVAPTALTHVLLQHGVEANTAQIPNLDKPVPVTPNALHRISEQWASLHRRLVDTLGVPNVDYSGDSYLAAIALLQANAVEQARLIDSLLAAQAALEKQLKDAGDAAVQQMKDLYDSFVYKQQVEYLTVRANVTDTSAQEKLDADVAKKLGEGWRVEFRAFNTTDGDGYLTHYEAVKLVRPSVPPPTGAPLKAAAEVPVPVETKTEDSRAVGEFERMIVGAVPVETAVMNGLVHLGDGHYRLPDEAL